jgi:hypothetical protein
MCDCEGNEMIRILIFFVGFFIGYYTRPCIDDILSEIFKRD